VSPRDRANLDREKPTEPTTMDCERFESAMMDELYGELDEVTSAAMKRHAAGCTHCAALLEGLQTTRRFATVALVDPPDGLEKRILAAAEQTGTVVPLRRRMARAVSLAGAWAMRPQTAMAAVFLVMIGTSVLFLRGRGMKDAAPASTPVTVTEEGSPAALEPSASASPLARAAPPTVAASAVATFAVPSRDEPLAHASRSAPAKDDDEREGQMVPGAPPPPAATFAVGDIPLGTLRGGAGGGGAGLADLDKAESEKKATSPFDSAVQAYQGGRYDDATRAFDALSAKDPAAVLWAARSVRDGKGCRAALQRFDQAAQRGANTPTGWDALLEGARCYRAVGQPAQARTRLGALLNVDSHKDAARRELDIIDQQSSASGAVRASAPKAAAAPAPAAPPASPNSKPAASTVDSVSQ
jgi:Putative zinc-finger